MAKIKLTKSAVDAAQAQAQPVELRDTLVPGFLCKITPAGRKVFMLQYRTNAGERRKPALGLYGELTVEQARSLAQEWLAQVRRGDDPATEKAAARQAPTVKELCIKFIEDYSSQRNKPSTQEGYQSVIDRNIIPMLGRMKVQDLKRPDVASMMKKMAHKPADANRTFSVMRKMFNLAEVWGYRPDGTNPCRHVPMYPNGKATHLISDEEMGKLFHYLDQLEAEGLEHAVKRRLHRHASHPDPQRQGQAGCQRQGRQRKRSRLPPSGGWPRHRRSVEKDQRGRTALRVRIPRRSFVPGDGLCPSD